MVPQIVKKVKIMSKSIEDRVGKKMYSALALFNNMTDEDFMMVHKAGQLKQLCYALSIDLQQTYYHEEDQTYTA
jgi:hypothetical protein